VTSEPGWHPDPGGAPQYRYWDGTRWTEHVAPFAETAPPAWPRVSGGVIAGIVALVVMIALASAVAIASDRSDNDDETPGPDTAREIVAKVGSIPDEVFASVGSGDAGPLPTKLPGPVLMRNGKPLVLYMGAEYCPYCATERWAIVAALSRFGSFEGVSLIRSAGFPEPFPATPTFTFHGSGYTSPYITFEGVEMWSNQRAPSGEGWVRRDVPTPEQRALMNRFGAPPYVPPQSAGGVPFIDLANTYLISGSQFSPAVLQDKGYDEIADEMADPTTGVSQGAIGSANLITAAICAVTKNQPARVCDDAAIKALQGDLRAQSVPGSIGQ
jgi:hypothetical protein